MKAAYCFDFDGTITSTELLPSIAAELGIAEEVETLTRLTMDGLIPFEQSLRLRAMLLNQVPVDVVHEIVRTVPLDADILRFIDSHSSSCFVVTGNLDLWLEPLADRLPCPVFASHAHRDGSMIKVDHVLDKGDAVRDLRAQGFDLIVAIGDGANDRPMLVEADLAIAFAGVHAPAWAAVEASDFVAFEGGALCRLLEGL